MLRLFYTIDHPLKSFVLYIEAHHLVRARRDLFRTRCHKVHETNRTQVSHVPVCQRVELAAGSHAPFHLKKGVTSVSWDMSCIDCTDDVPWVAYGLFETEQFKQLEAANLLDEERDNNKPVSIECQSVFVDLRRDSTRVLPLKASIDYTRVAVNYNDHAVTVSGKAAAFACVRRHSLTYDTVSLMYAVPPPVLLARFACR